MRTELDLFATGELLNPNEFLTHALGIAGVSTAAELDARRKVLILEAFHQEQCDRNYITLNRLGLTGEDADSMSDILWAKHGHMRTLASLLIGFEASEAEDWDESDTFLMR